MFCTRSPTQQRNHATKHLCLNMPTKSNMKKDQKHNLPLFQRPLYAIAEKLDPQSTSTHSRHKKKRQPISGLSQGRGPFLQLCLKKEQKLFWCHEHIINTKWCKRNAIFLFHQQNVTKQMLPCGLVIKTMLQFRVMRKTGHSEAVAIKDHKGIEATIFSRTARKNPLQQQPRKAKNSRRRICCRVPIVGPAECSGLGVRSS